MCSPKEQTQFWDTQWLGRLKSSKKAEENRDITGVPFDQPEIPYTALYLLGLLREEAGCDVNIIDLWEKGSYEIKTESLHAASKEFQVFLFSPFTSNYSFAQTCVAEIKRLNPNSICIAGGHHASFCELECLNDGFNYVVKGKGEKAIIELAKLSWKSNIAIINEIDYTKEETNRWNRIVPAYDLLPEKYRRTYYARLFTTHGCPYQCVFCSNTVWHKKNTLFIPIERVKSELSHIKSNISFEEIYVNDENFTLQNKHFTNISKLLWNEGVDWGCETRVDIVSKEQLKTLANYGCREIDFGLESLDANVLKIVKKGINVEDAYRTFSEATEQGIRCHVNLMIGLPGETEKTALKTVQVICEWLRQGIVSTVDYFVTVPYPGTELFTNPNKYGMIINNNNWNNYREDCAPVFDLRTMNSRQIYSCWLKGLNEFTKTIKSIWN